MQPNCATPRLGPNYATLRHGPTASTTLGGHFRDKGPLR